MTSEEPAYLAQIPPVVHNLGRPGFDEALLAAVHALTRCSIVMGFLHLPGRMIPLATAGMAGHGDQDEQAVVASFRYAGRLWLRDGTLTDGLHALREGSLRVQTDLREELEDEPHLARLFDFLGAARQFSLYWRVGRGVHILRLYHPRGEARPEAAEALARHGEVLIALVIRHGELKKRSRTPILHASARTEITKVLTSFHHRLTSQQVAVCRGILLGKTAEAISLDLGVAESSVRTYRKRAFRRLGISSQAELFALCFNEMTAR